jgi:hypothetical protein
VRLVKNCAQWSKPQRAIDRPRLSGVTVSAAARSWPLQGIPMVVDASA